MKLRIPVMLAALMALGSGCHRPAPYRQTGPPAVTVTNPASEPVTPSIDLTGTVAAYQTVNLVARVEGFLEKIEFQDGSFVDKGTALFEIEKDTYQQKVLLYQAQLDQAQSEYNRQVGMLKQNATSQANVEKWLSERDQAEANLQLAKIQLNYTTVTAPFDGRMGEHLIDVGNVVGTNAADPTKLAVIDQLVPIYVNFSVSSRQALQLRTLSRKLGLGIKPGVGKLPVFVGLEDEEGYPHQGVLDFANNSVDTSTGTLQLRAIFPNQDKILFPGLFARVRIPLGDPAAALVIPNEAVANDQQGDYVLVVNASEIVERRNVTLGPQVGSGRAITNGLTADDRVIVGGLTGVRPGEAVKATLAAASPAPSPASSPAPTGAGQ